MTANRVLSPNRVVAVLTPLVFAPLAGALATWLAEHFPGVEVSSGSLEEIFIAGSLIALAPATQWLHGWQKYEARQATLEQEGLLANPALAPPPPGLQPEPAAIAEEVDTLEEPFDDEVVADDEAFDDDALADDEVFALADDDAPFADDDLEALDALDEDADDLDELDDDLEADLLDEEETAAAGS